MTHLCCSACGLRFDKSDAALSDECTKCGGPLLTRTASETLGFRLAGPATMPAAAQAALTDALRKQHPPAPPAK